MTELNVSNQGIKDLTGIEYFTKLEILFCYGNDISSANMTKLVNLLPETDYAILVVNYVGCNPDNVITKAQAKIAEEKGWIVYRCLNDEDFELYDGEDISLTTATFFPDANFRSCLAAYDTNGDNVLSDTELGKVNEINVAGKGITDLTGIEHFYNLLTLNCSNNSLTALDVSNNTALTYLDCGENSLKSLDVSNNTALTKLYCGSNSLESLDVSKNTALTELDCSDNSLKSLDVTKNTALTYLDCIYIGLTSLDVSNNKALTRLYCSFNSLKSLDVSKNTLLKELYCYGNQISGEAMTNLVNSLPTLPSGTEGFLVVCDVYNVYIVYIDGKPDNIITASQVKVAIDKRWKVYNSSYRRLAEYAGQGDVNLDNKINKDDLDKLVEIIMRLATDHGYFASDLNHDGKTDAADIVVMVNILKSLGK